ncbi:hypothetical protein BU16DRAFT_20303 [Lophium mytilinum]|uniref:Uncharacterized protein n=1 Tax=Lophium mytilinum TaxID=390894 RepID=A0A6A6REI9_9PEZI|nr:hypothetical protein BU16DRAFT_20303 [Lophium mytilinum]
MASIRQDLACSRPSGRLISIFHIISGARVLKPPPTTSFSCSTSLVSLRHPVKYLFLSRIQFTPNKPIMSRRHRIYKRRSTQPIFYRLFLVCQTFSDFGLILLTVNTSMELCFSSLLWTFYFHCASLSPCYYHAVSSRILRICMAFPVAEDAWDAGRAV